MSLLACCYKKKTEKMTVCGSFHFWHLTLLQIGTKQKFLSIMLKAERKDDQFINALLCKELLKIVSFFQTK
jgi:hypothetical protein